jgi:hypothetical protein
LNGSATVEAVIDATPQGDRMIGLASDVPLDVATLWIMIVEALMKFDCVPVVSLIG